MVDIMVIVMVHAGWQDSWMTLSQLAPPFSTSGPVHARPVEVNFVVVVIHLVHVLSAF